MSNRAPARTSATRWGALTARQRRSAHWRSLNAIATAAAREPGPLVTRCRSRTVAKVDSIGYVPIVTIFSAIAIAVLMFYDIDRSTHPRNIERLHGGGLHDSEAGTEIRIQKTAQASLSVIPDERLLKEG